MLTAFLILFLVFISFVVYKEYKNEKSYRKERKKYRNNSDLIKPERENGNIVPKEVSGVSVSKTKYPDFTYMRLIDMGFSANEAKTFVLELIKQIEIEIPLIAEAIENRDYYQIERHIHNIKGSATNIGTGGVSDLLVEYNIYLKNGTDISIIKSYFKELVKYTDILKKQYT